MHSHESKQSPIPIIVFGVLFAAIFVISSFSCKPASKNGTVKYYEIISQGHTYRAVMICAFFNGCVKFQDEFGQYHHVCGTYEVHEINN